MTADQAYDEMLAVFKTAWDTTGFAATYTDVPASVPSSEDPWTRFTCNFNGGGQTGFGATEVKKYSNTGVLTVQVFAPLGDGGTEARRLGQLVLEAFSRKRGSVWYRNLHIKSAPANGGFSQINVTADFTYDDQR